MIDLKTKKITHQDVGQMDMYVRMYDELKKAPDDNPTIGIVLCSETDEETLYELSLVAKNTAVRKAIIAHHNCTLEMARNMFK